MSDSNIIPAIRYKNCQVAIEWLCEVLGFKKHVVYESDGIVHHGELSFGNGMIMVGTYRDLPYDSIIKVPEDIENINTQSAYIFVDDLKRHYDHARAKGASIVLPLKEEPHGSGYTCRDPEGYLWSFGDFNPWKSEVD